MVIRIKRAGQLRADVVSELLKYLRYRYELSERVLVHHAKLAADVMIGKTMEMWLGALKSTTGDKAAVESIEAEALRRSDDGLLEYLLDEATKHDGDQRWQAIGKITTQLQNRMLFKSAGAYTRRGRADELYERHGGRNARAELERDAARYAGIEDDWMIGLWVPNPEMRLKPAAVLVDDGAGTEIVPLEAWDFENGRRGSEIIQSHHDLWAIRVYVDRSLTADQQAVVLGRLQSTLGINGWVGSHRRVSEVAAERVLAEKPGTLVTLDELVQLADDLLPHHPTFDALVEALSGTVTIRERRGLEKWRARGRPEIEHPNLEATIVGAADSLVTLDGTTFDSTNEADVVRLNLRLSVQDLPKNPLRTADNLDLIHKCIDEAPDDLESRFAEQVSVGSASRRTDRTTAPTDPRVLAFEAAVRDTLSTTTGPRLFE